ncbi:putative MFS-type transporter C09D4.1-like protein [Dinothrombium tinctorium]|uniref:Putative MFS-type transporter C09D4.1-like protein n=1 Tax=Dinothrombium tinctorium TaxID=1965070 RepID=A0A3S3NRE6_9ACAR|nr:putative MFS-type transporter C09D4.1-like protein [Dinothrombium tinctorium]RWS00358.1 putative MFS-type transporter C09D4.1-like protein [Dinothrombium tinctorium]RWS00512.1 putative MFS-type transporter C09D4.1-like protein [Dinothrombium tinctorium]RWS00724.1 putative MFS-type transporter C09D4.1-like protein [Dinothrombium tinctorium]
MEKSDEIKMKSYKRRYLILAVITIATSISCFQLLEHSSIGDVIIKYYRVNYSLVSWTALLSNISGIFFFYPISKFITHFGLRKSLFVELFFCILGSIIRCTALGREQFWLLLIGKILPSFSLMALTYQAPVLAAIWFKPKEAALVVGINTSMCTLGLGISFALPKLYDNADIEKIRSLLFYTSLITAIIFATLLLLTYFFVIDEPPKPPSLAAQKRKDNTELPLKFLLTNRNFLLLFCAAFTYCGLMQSIPVTLNQLILNRFTNGHDTLSLAGTLFQFASIAGGLISPSISKKYPKYRLLLFAHIILVIIPTSAYLYGLWTRSSLCVFISLLFFGLIYSGAHVLIVDYAIEVSFPFPESISSSIIYMASMSSGLILTQVVTICFQKWKSLYVCFVFVLVELLCLLYLSFMSKETKRLEADRAPADNEKV